MTRSARYTKQLELWTQHRPLALNVARDYYLPGAERKDTEQEALIALWEACQDYDPTKGSFAGFARVVVRRRLITAVKVATRERNNVLTRAERTTLDAEGDEVSVVEVIAGGHDPADVVLSRERLGVLVDGVRALAAIEREGIGHVVNGLEYKGNRRIDNAIQRARRKLARALEAAA